MSTMGATRPLITAFDPMGFALGGAAAAPTSA